MKIIVKVKPNSRHESCELHSDGSWIVKVNAPPNEGQANIRVIELLSRHLKKPKSAFEILSGHKSKSKVIKVS